MSTSEIMIKQGKTYGVLRIEYSMQSKLRERAFIPIKPVAAAAFEPLKGTYILYETKILYRSKEKGYAEE